MLEQIMKEEEKYEQEHEECNAYYDEIVIAERTKFDEVYLLWKAAVVRFHIIKQDQLLEGFVAAMDSKRFSNPQTRVDIFMKIQAEQKQLYEQRTNII
jgi:hypothetical protein